MSYKSPWPDGWREKTLKELKDHWDLIVVGGGITGAGVLGVSARLGLRVLLVEKADFASGTSSRSSKLVHGGLRYLKHMQVRLTRESVQERQQMLEAAPGLVEPLGFVYPVYEGDKPSPWLVEIGLGVYTRLAPDAGRYKRLDRLETSLLAPGINTENLERAFHYGDAQTDDARLVLRIIHDALVSSRGMASAINYCPATTLLKEKNKVCGVRVNDLVSGESFEAFGNVVINATGAWADELRSSLGKARRLRPLRGSHLIFPLERLPVYQSIAFSHPDDGRPVFVFPWEGVALAGTTDVDHESSLDEEPAVSTGEAEYILKAVRFIFPELDLGRQDVLSTQAGIRPVIDTGKKDPSAESREHAVWQEKGLLTVTGGKLTTFRLIALDALREARKMSKKIPEPGENIAVFNKLKAEFMRPGLDDAASQRLRGRYGEASTLFSKLESEDLSSIEGTPFRWAELVLSASAEAVIHLDDLLLRRTRIGLLLRDGGKSLLPLIKARVLDKLGWDDARWNAEAERYERIRRLANGLPDFRAERPDVL